jgi:hydrogenase maturation protease
MVPRASVVIIGVGNDYRTDDAAGLLAARRLAALGLPGVHVVDSVGDGTDLINAWENMDKAIVIDSVRSESAPGKVYRFDGLTAEIDLENLSACSTHAFSIPETIALARTLDRLPQSLVIYGVEADSFAPGEGLTEAVAEGVDKIVQMIRAEIEK